MSAAAPAPAAPAASPAPAPADQTTITPAAAAPPAAPAVVAPAAPAAPPAAPAPAAPPKAPTALDPGADPAAPAPGAFPDDWRKQLSKGDEKIAKRLERYASPIAVAEALIHAQDRIAKGVKPGLSPNATPEEVKEYRAMLGVPEKPEDYKIELPEGRVVGDEDNPLVAKFVARMHGANASPAIVNQALAAYYDIQEAGIEAREDADVDQKVKTTDELRSEYGPEHKANMNAVHGLLAGAPAGLAAQLHDARLPDGTLVFNHAPMVRWLVNLATELNPAAKVAPGSSGNAAQTLSDEISALKAEMNNPESEYHKGPKIEKGGIKDTAKAHRYRELLEAQERMQAAGRMPKAA